MQGNDGFYLTLGCLGGGINARLCMEVFLLFCVVQFFFCSGIDDTPRTTPKREDTTPEVSYQEERKFKKKKLKKRRKEERSRRTFFHVID